MDFLAFVITGFCPDDHGHLFHRAIEHLDILNRFPKTHIDDDLHQPGNFHGVLVTKLLDECGNDFLLIVIF